MAHAAFVGVPIADAPAMGAKSPTPTCRQLELDWPLQPAVHRAQGSVQYLCTPDELNLVCGLLVRFDDEAFIRLRWNKPVPHRWRQPIEFLASIASEPMSVQIGLDNRATTCLAELVAAAAEWCLHRAGPFRIGGIQVGADLDALIEDPGVSRMPRRYAIADALLDALCGAQLRAVMETLAESGTLSEHGKHFDWHKVTCAKVFLQQWRGPATLLLPLTMRRGNTPPPSRALLRMLSPLPGAAVATIAHRALALTAERAARFLYFLATYLRQYLRRLSSSVVPLPQEHERLPLLIALAERRALLEVAPHVIETSDAETFSLLPACRATGRLRSPKASESGASKEALLAWVDVVLTRILTAQPEDGYDLRYVLHCAVDESSWVLESIIYRGLASSRIRTEPLWHLAQEAAFADMEDAVPQSWPCAKATPPEAVAARLRSAGLEVVELATYQALITEGDVLGHCVGSPKYALQAGRGDLRIFSVTSSRLGGLRATMAIARSADGWELSELSDGVAVDLIQEPVAQARHGEELGALLDFVAHFCE